jgi:hypothetical protein
MVVRAYHPAMWETRRSIMQDPVSKLSKTKMARGMAEVIQYLPTSSKPSLNSSTDPTNKKKGKKN